MAPHVDTALPQGSAAGSSGGSRRPLLLGTLQKHQLHKNTCTVSGQRSLNPVSHLWQWPQMDTEGRERTRQAYKILPSDTSPSALSVCNYFQVRRFSELDGVSPYLGSSMDFSARYFFSFLLGPKRVLASTTSSRNNLPRFGTHSVENHLLLLWTWLLLVLFNVLVLKETLNGWPLSTPLRATPEPGKLYLRHPTGF